MPLRGPGREIGRVRAVGGQDRLGAIQLPYLDILGQFVTQLRIPIAAPGEKTVVADLNVPFLGAFLVTRGAIFQQRSATAGTQKPGKDLLYIHDVLAGGEDVVARVASDLRTMVWDSQRVRDYVDYAANHVSLALGNDSPAIREAAVMLAEREGMNMENARAAVRGFLTDFVEMLREAVSAG